jgi:predicted nucleic acid-binding protein
MASVKPPATVVDASFVVGLCAKEANKHATAKAKLAQCAVDGAELFAPGLLVNEVMYALCNQRQSNVLGHQEYVLAMQSFIALMRNINPPPLGDASLITRADQILNSMGCSHTADSFYLALAEQLQASRTTTVVTFDEGMDAHAKATAATVQVELLPVGKP